MQPFGACGKGLCKPFHVAPKPCGADFEAASKCGIKVIWALSLPAKTAPVTAGKIVAETVENILSERFFEKEGL